MQQCNTSDVFNPEHGWAVWGKPSHKCLFAVNYPGDSRCSSNSLGSQLSPFYVYFFFIALPKSRWSVRLLWLPPTQQRQGARRGRQGPRCFVWASALPLDVVIPLQLLCKWRGFHLKIWWWATCSPGSRVVDTLSHFILCGPLFLPTIPPRSPGIRF